MKSGRVALVAYYTGETLYDSSELRNMLGPAVCPNTWCRVVRETDGDCR